MLGKEMLELIGKGVLETLYMTLYSTILAYIIGLPLGIILVTTDKKGIHPLRIVNSILGLLINFLRSVPFIILLIWVIPFTRKMIGTSLGSTATVIPLVIASAPYIARLVESSLKEVDKGVIEAAESMGSKPNGHYLSCVASRSKTSASCWQCNCCYNHTWIFRHVWFRRRWWPW